MIWNSSLAPSTGFSSHYALEVGLIYSLYKAESYVVRSYGTVNWCKEHLGNNRGPLEASYSGLIPTNNQERINNLNTKPPELNQLGAQTWGCTPTQRIQPGSMTPICRLIRDEDLLLLLLTSWPSLRLFCGVSCHMFMIFFNSWLETMQFKLALLYIFLYVYSS
jgi:hypothetical protein